MDAFVWDDRFCTGIASVDEQHRRLIDLVNRVGRQLLSAEDTPVEELERIFAELAAYVAFHFQDEQAVMTAGGLDPGFVEAHSVRHRELAEQVTAMWEGRAGLAKPAETLHGFLAEWLTFHILGEDQAMARQLARVRAGMTPAAALEAERGQQDAPTAALLAALGNLYSLLAAQNRELVAANRGLEEKVAERTRALLQAEKMVSIGQLAAGVAHEINNPIAWVTSNVNSLAGYVDQLLPLAEAGATTPAGKALLAADDLDLEFLRTDLGELLVESRSGLERVRKIVANLKDFSHLDEVHWQQADLVAELEKTVSVVWHELKQKAVLVRELAPLPLVHCIPVQLNQVFANLLVNAAQSIDGRGVITLRSGRQGDEVFLEIADTGCGMDETTQRRLFEPFFTTKPIGTGTGLGLSVTWDIVQKSGGAIEVKSAPGQGSTFRIRLPIAGPPPAPTPR